MKVIYYLTIAIVNKCFKFQNDSLKISALGTMVRSFTLYRCVKEIEIRTTAVSLERYAPKSNLHQFMLRCV